MRIGLTESRVQVRRFPAFESHMSSKSPSMESIVGRRDLHNPNLIDLTFPLRESHHQAAVLDESFLVVFEGCRWCSIVGSDLLGENFHILPQNKGM